MSQSCWCVEHSFIIMYVCKPVIHPLQLGEPVGSSGERSVYVDGPFWRSFDHLDVGTQPWKGWSGAVLAASRLFWPQTDPFWSIPVHHTCDYKGSSTCSLPDWLYLWVWTWGTCPISLQSLLQTCLGFYCPPACLGLCCQVSLSDSVSLLVSGNNFTRKLFLFYFILSQCNQISFVWVDRYDVIWFTVQLIDCKSPEVTLCGWWGYI